MTHCSWYFYSWGRCPSTLWQTYPFKWSSRSRLTGSKFSSSSLSCGTQQHSITPAWPWTVARVQSYTWPPHHPEESIQSAPCPSAALAGIRLLSIYHRWALAIKRITLRGDSASISTIKPDSGAAPLLSIGIQWVMDTLEPLTALSYLRDSQGDTHWLTHTDRQTHSLKQKHLVTSGFFFLLF